MLMVMDTMVRNGKKDLYDKWLERAETRFAEDDPVKEYVRENLSGRLSALVGDQSVNGFATRVGVGVSLFRKYLAGAEPGLDKAIQIASGAGVSLGWLATGRFDTVADVDVMTAELARRLAAINQDGDHPDMLGMREMVLSGLAELDRVRQTLLGSEDGSVVRGGPSRRGSSADQLLLASEFALLPRYNVSASAGNGLVAAEYEEEIERIAFRHDWLRRIGLDPGRAGLLTAEGDSMFPTIPDGALMLIDQRSNQPIRSGYIYVIVLDGEVLVKRVSRNVDKTIDLISDNPLYPVQKVEQVDFDRLYVAGRVYWVGRTM